MKGREKNQEDYRKNVKKEINKERTLEHLKKLFLNKQKQEKLTYEMQE